MFHIIIYILFKKLLNLLENRFERMFILIYINVFFKLNLNFQVDIYNQKCIYPFKFFINFCVQLQNFIFIVTILKCYFKYFV